MVLCNPYNPLGRVMEPASSTPSPPSSTATAGRCSPTRSTPRSSTPATATSRTRLALDVTAAATPSRRSRRRRRGTCPGLKCAQLIVNDVDRAHLESLGPYAINSASTFGVLASTAAFTHGRSWLADIVAYLDGNRRLLADLLAEQLPDVGYTPPGGHVPDVARLPSARPARGPCRVLPAARRRGRRRRGALRDPRPRVRAPQHRHQPPDPDRGRRADGGGRPRPPRLRLTPRQPPRRSAPAAPRPAPGIAASSAPIAAARRATSASASRRAAASATAAAVTSSGDSASATPASTHAAALAG